MILALDTETTGLVERRLPLENPSQPNVVQITALLVDGDRIVGGLSDCLIRPEDGWLMSPKAEAVHGISIAHARRYGVPARPVLSIVTHLAKCAKEVVAFNGAFDRDVLAGMLLRMGADPAVSITRPGLIWRDVMQMAEIPCDIRREDGSTKWPTLSEAVRIILNREHAGAHSSSADALATLELYRALSVEAVG